MKNIILILLSLLIFNGCKSEPELAMERGIHYYELGETDKAAIEFNRAVLLLKKIKNKNIDDFELLSQAYHNLAIAYSKQGLNNYARDAAEESWKLSPTPKHRSVLQLINNRIAKE